MCRAHLDCLVASNHCNEALALLEEAVADLEETLGADDYRMREARGMIKHFTQRWSDEKGP